MKEWINKYLNRFYLKFTDFLNIGGGYVIFILAIVAIALATVGFYWGNGFDWRWFLFLHLPVYIFCCWGMCTAFKEYRKFLKSRDR